ncbi:Asp23/Gls24 family envelope stress response protein [Enemella evansiae]|uniref:Asp23/Gls24 family envelope stress response protein n=1 Tax=Enemella evansiae TaxID=2016499 RepID=UPI001E4C6480|nr:Asp23/Gls24 family envelope stress response protein [Enemella evansiae]
MEPDDRSPDRGPQEGDSAADQRYLDLVRSVHREWDELEARGDSSVQLSQQAVSSIKEAVRVDARHGAQVTMPPTEAGPYTLTELALRTLVRSAVDEVPDALALRTTVDYADAEDNSVRARGLPERVKVRLSVRLGTPDLIGVAEQVRESVRSACRSNLELPDIVVDIHIEDLYEYAS